MSKYFNTAGPVVADDHYIFPPLQRKGAESIRELLEQKRYFILHAPRQTGKTTALLQLVKDLKADGVRAVYVNVESAQTARSNVAEGIRTIAGCLARDARSFSEESYFDEHWLEALDSHGPNAALGALLSGWAAAEASHAVLFVDEIDSLVGDTLVSVLRQLRAGYANRPAHFPAAVVLCGVRDVKDYRIQTSDGEIITGGSCFNIKDTSLTMGNFTEKDLAQFYAQHTTLTGQAFTEDALALAWEYTNGQPWLVNAIGRQCCFESEGVLDRTQSIDADAMRTAKERLVLSRATHLDQLADKLCEPRVRHVIEPIILGEDANVNRDDIEYCLDLGLIRREHGLQIANAIYREVIPRELSQNQQVNFEARFEPDWIKKDGSLDEMYLITLFQDFWRENSETWTEHLREYREAAPHLVLQAFLQRVANGKGMISREYALGRRRTDLMLEWPLPEEGRQKIVLELKVVHKSPQATITQGIKQTADYADRCGVTMAHLLIFDKSPERNWDARIFRREEQFEGKAIIVWGM